jgi:hypothetical protein
MSSGKSKFYLLPQIHQRALHELYLNRHDSNFVVSEETREFILQNPQVFTEEFADYERDPHLKDSYSQFTDSSGVEIRLLQDTPRTPLPDTSSESEGESSPWFVRKISASSGSNSDSVSPAEIDADSFNDHSIKTNVTILHKSPKGYTSSKSHHSDSMSNIDNYQENENDLNGGEDGELIQLGLNGKPLDDQSYSSKVYVSNKPRTRLDGSIPIDYHLINRFVSQIKNEPGNDLVIEKLIDSVSWKQILRIAKGLNQDINSVTQSQRLQQILLLETYVLRKEGEVFNLDNKVWITPLCVNCCKTVTLSL